jgi:hypothetical protein
MTEREMLRHTLATLAYRGGKAVRDVQERFATFKAGPTTRTPVEVLAHVGDLVDWALAMARGDAVWRDSPPLPWAQEIARFHEALRTLDTQLASEAPLATSAEILFQGPVADALTHVGQITLLRRMFGAPVRGENYARAEIVAGRVGAEQAAPRREFD